MRPRSTASVVYACVAHVVVVVAVVGLAAGCPTSAVSPTGKPCTDDGDCTAPPGSKVDHCELGLKPAICLPGHATVAAPHNLVPFARQTTIVAEVGEQQDGVLDVVDPEGATITVNAVS